MVVPLVEEMIFPIILLRPLIAESTKEVVEAESVSQAKLVICVLVVQEFSAASPKLTTEAPSVRQPTSVMVMVPGDFQGRILPVEVEKMKLTTLV